MKNLNYIIVAGLLFIATGCSKKTLDNINNDVNNAHDVLAVNELPSVTLESAFNVTGTELAWFASIYTEQNVGWGGAYRSADNRSGAASPALFDNNWHIVYENLMVLRDIINKCSPTGSEPLNKPTLGVAQILTAYNLAIATDMWGQIPWTEALQGQQNMQPKFDKQEDIYNAIFTYLNDGIENLLQPFPDGMESMAALFAKNDLIYGGTRSLWRKAAWSLKARYFLRLEQVVPDAVDSALNCMSAAFAGPEDAFLFNKYEPSPLGENPWYQFSYDNGSLAIGNTLYELMADRNDPRVDYYFYAAPFGDGSFVPGPNGEASQSSWGVTYAVSAMQDGQTAPTPLMSYHELKFIEAEALARKGEDFTDALKEAIEASFVYHDIPYSIDYYDNEVAPRLGTSDQNLEEILTQKYIALYEAEAIEVYNDVRRTGIPTMNNPNNNLASYGFVQRYPYPISERQANSANLPSVNIFQDKVWWAGGTE